jgi:dipeptidyl-peptidase-4
VADPRLLLADDGDIPAAELARRERMRETTAGITSYSTDFTGNLVGFALSGQLFTGNISSGQFTAHEVTGPVIDPKVSPNGEHVAWSNGKDLYLCNFDGTSEINLTAETSEDTSWGLADFIAAEEFGRMHGFWWSPDSTELIVEQTNDSQVQSWWISDNKRTTYNVASTTGNFLAANISDAEATSGNTVDFLSNGFKIRTAYDGTNNSGSTPIYMAFAENPFVSATAIPTTAR